MEIQPTPAMEWNRPVSERNVRICEGFRMPAHDGRCRELRGWGRRSKTPKGGNRGKGYVRRCTISKSAHLQSIKWYLRSNAQGSSGDSPGVARSIEMLVDPEHLPDLY